MRKWGGVLLVLVASGAAGPAWAGAQDPMASPTASGPIRAVPGAGVLDVERLEPFEAEYEQFGSTMHVRLARELTGAWSFTMENAGPTGTGVDHVVHGAADLAFVRRHFAFGAFRNEYLEVDAAEGGLAVRRLLRDSATVIDPILAPADGPLVDGTFLFWALGLLPLGGEDVYTFPTWSPTPDGARARESGALTVTGTVTYDAGLAGTVEATVVEAAAGDGRVRMHVVPHAPFLLRQESIDAAGAVTLLLELRSVRRPLDAEEARSAIAAASRRFSEAYRAGDVETVRSLYTGDARLLPPDRVVRGRLAIGRYFAPVPSRSVLEHEMASESLTLAPDHAVDVGTWRQVARSDGSGDVTRASGRYLIVWRREIDGAWRIAEDMWHRPATGSQ